MWEPKQWTSGEAAPEAPSVDIGDGGSTAPTVLPTAAHTLSSSGFVFGMVVLPDAKPGSQLFALAWLLERFACMSTAGGRLIIMPALMHMPLVQQICERIPRQVFVFHDQNIIFMLVLFLGRPQEQKVQAFWSKTNDN